MRGVLPEYEEFASLWERGETQLVRSVQAADLETPVSVFLKLSRGRAYSSLFESIEGGVNIGRYSFISTDSDLVWRADGNTAYVSRMSHSGSVETKEEIGALESLRRLVAKNRFQRRDGDGDGDGDGEVKMAGGLVGFLGYDMVRQMERLPNAGHPRDSVLADGMFFRPRTTAIFDRVGDSLTLVTVVRGREGKSASEAWQTARERLEEARERLASPIPPSLLPQSKQSKQTQAPREDAPPPLNFKSNMSEEDYCAMVERAREYIRAGDIYQVVLSQRFSARSDVAPFDFYRALRRRNPAPFLFYLQLEGAAVAGSSPEILVRVEDGEILSRPLAGTRPRGRNEAEDQALERELLTDEKERAEHLMLLDLGRNDVGRVAATGSVEVPRSFAIERYSRVMHISSSVRGRLAAGLEAMDALISTFPAGTLSGAPKVRAMEIIEELEKSRRGLYAGAVGYFDPHGNLDSCIVLRTAVLEGGEIRIQAGAGIVADSNPKSEHEECLRKASALFLAAQDSR
ncbi:MAG: anthranilate synthase component I [Alphaproteobacteria bacterium]